MSPNVAIFLDLTVMVLITLIYVAIAAVLFKLVEKHARITGTMVEA
jgi:Tfp pilus assembly protein PilX